MTLTVLVFALATQLAPRPATPPLTVEQLLILAQDGVNEGCDSRWLDPGECVHVTGIIDAAKRDVAVGRPDAVVLDRLVQGLAPTGAFSHERHYLDWVIQALYKRTTPTRARG